MYRAFGKKIKWASVQSRFAVLIYNYSISILHECFLGSWRYNVQCYTSSDGSTSSMVPQWLQSLFWRIHQRISSRKWFFQSLSWNIGQESGLSKGCIIFVFLKMDHPLLATLPSSLTIIALPAATLSLSFWLFEYHIGFDFNRMAQPVSDNNFCHGLVSIPEYFILPPLWQLAISTPFVCLTLPRQNS